jgi:hypothetical protein
LVRRPERRSLSLIAFQHRSSGRMQTRLMRAVTGVDQRSRRAVTGGRPGQMFPAMVAFLAEADAVRPVELQDDASARPMAEDETRKGGGHSVNKMENDRGEAENRAFRARTPVVSHGRMIAFRRAAVKEANRARGRRTFEGPQAERPESPQPGRKALPGSRGEKKAGLPSGRPAREKGSFI